MRVWSPLKGIPHQCCFPPHSNFFVLYETATFCSASSSRPISWSAAPTREKERVEAGNKNTNINIIANLFAMNCEGWTCLSAVYLRLLFVSRFHLQSIYGPAFIGHKFFVIPRAVCRALLSAQSQSASHLLQSACLSVSQRSQASQSVHADNACYSFRHLRRVILHLLAR